MQNLLNDVLWAKKPGTNRLYQYKFVEIVKSNFTDEVYIVEELEETNGRKARMAVLELYIDDTLNINNEIKH